MAITGWLIAALFAAGVLQLFLLRVDDGDVYSEYSTLRSDPMGARAFYESLERMPGLAVSRHTLPLEEMRGVDATLFFLAVVPAKLDADKEFGNRLEQLARGGARVVVGLAPTFNDKGEPVELNRWRLTIRKRAPAEVVELPMGAGRMVFLTDCFPLSNQALMMNRDVKLLSRLVGAPPRVVFDEWHLGVRETGSIVALARKYGLGGFAVALLVLAALFIWKSSASLLPPLTDAGSGGEVQGQDAASGFVNLIRRFTPPAKLIAVAVAEWRASASLGRHYSEERLEAANAAAAAGEGVVSTYNRIAGVLRHREMS